MPQRRTAIKELRKTRTRRMRNLDIKTDLKKTIKTFLTALKDKKMAPQESLQTIYKKFDKAAKRDVLHKKTASRRKSSFAKLLAASK